MQNLEQQSLKKKLNGTIWGLFLVALCCFTPLLVLVLAAVGLGALTPYLDFVLFPVLAIMLIILILIYRKYRKTCMNCEIKK